MSRIRDASLWKKERGYDLEFRQHERPAVRNSRHALCDVVDIRSGVRREPRGDQAGLQRRGGDIGGGCHSEPPSAAQATILGSAGIAGTPRLDLEAWTAFLRTSCGTSRMSSTPAPLPVGCDP